MARDNTRTVGWTRRQNADAPYKHHTGPTRCIHRLSRRCQRGWVFWPNFIAVHLINAIFFQLTQRISLETKAPGHLSNEVFYVFALTSKTFQMLLFFCKDIYNVKQTWVYNYRYSKKWKLPSATRIIILLKCNNNANRLSNKNHKECQLLHQRLS